MEHLLPFFETVADATFMADVAQAKPDIKAIHASMDNEVLVSARRLVSSSVRNSHDINLVCFCRATYCLCVEYHCASNPPPPPPKKKKKKEKRKKWRG